MLPREQERRLALADLVADCLRDRRNPALVSHRQAENLIKMDKVQLASDRTSCQSPVANQVRLVLHGRAYWLLLSLRDAVPAASPDAALFRLLAGRLAAAGP